MLSWIVETIWLPLAYALLAAGGAGMCVVGRYAWKRRATRGNAYFALMMFCFAAYTLCVLIEVASSTLAAKIFWSKAQYAAFLHVPPLWLLFALSYSDFDIQIRRRWAVLLWLFPLFCFLLVATNEWHGLAWPHVLDPDAGSGRMVRYVHGPVTWATVVYSYFLTIVGVVLIAVAAQRAGRLYRVQIAALVLAVAAVLAGNFLYMTGYMPLSGLDVAPISYAIAGVLIGYSVLRQRFLSIKPAAVDAVLDGMREGVIVLDADKRVTHLNRAARDFLALSDFTIGIAVKEAFSAFPVLVPPSERCVELQSAVGERTLEASITPLPTQWRGTGWLYLLRDVTEEKRAEETRERMSAHLIQAQRMESLGTLAGGIAHDFNNMFTIILGAAELTRKRVGNDAAAERLIETIVDTVQRGAILARQMLDYAGEGALSFAHTNLSAFIEQIAPVLRLSVPEHIAVNYDLAEALPMIHADAAQLHQVLLSMTINAAEAIDLSEGAITIATRLRHCNRLFLEDADTRPDQPEGDYVVIDVRDTGCGIDESILPRIFEPFYTTKFLGRGLGLAAALGIVRGHHGFITVSSRPGEGALFSVFLPVERR